MRDVRRPEVAYVCGQLRILEAPTARTRRASTGATRWGCARPSRRLGSVTGGNGSIYAVRRADYVEVDPRFGHDLSLPYLMVQRGRRAVYEPEAHAFEKPTPTNETEYRRKVRMFEHCWLIVLRGKMLRRLPPVYLAGARLAPAPPLRERAAPLSCSGRRSRSSAHGVVYEVVLGPSSACSRPRWPGSGSPRYYVLVTWATVVALWNYLRRGVPATWDAAGGHALNRALDVTIAGVGARRSLRRSSRSPRSRSSSRIAGRCSTGRRASARTAPTSSC